MLLKKRLRKQAKNPVEKQARKQLRNKPELSLRVRAMRYLARREHSRAELHSKLQPHVQEGEDLNAVLDELEKRNWLSDARATTQWVDAKRGRFGSQRIAHELRQKGIPENLISDAMPQLKETELEAVREVWQRKFGVQPGDSREKAKQIRFLQSRGFSMEVIFKVLRHDGQFE
jgi:regulatory protein